MTKTNDWGHRLSDIPVGTRIRVAAGASRLSTEVTGVAVAVGIARVKTKKAPYYGHRYGYGSAEWAFDESKPGNWIVVDLGDGRYSEQFLTGIDHCLQVKGEQRPQSIVEMRELLGMTDYVRIPSPASGREIAPGANTVPGGVGRAEA